MKNKGSNHNHHLSSKLSARKKCYTPTSPTLTLNCFCWLAGNLHVFLHYKIYIPPDFSSLVTTTFSGGSFWVSEFKGSGLICEFQFKGHEDRLTHQQVQAALTPPFFWNPRGSLHSFSKYLWAPTKLVTGDVKRLRHKILCKTQYWEWRRQTGSYMVIQNHKLGTVG